MADEEAKTEEEDDEPQLDEDDPGEVGTSFSTKGMGWSGRENRPK